MSAPTEPPTPEWQRRHDILVTVVLRWGLSVSHAHVLGFVDDIEDALDALNN